MNRRRLSKTSIVNSSESDIEEERVLSGNIPTTNNGARCVSGLNLIYNRHNSLLSPINRQVCQNNVDTNGPITASRLNNVVTSSNNVRRRRRQRNRRYNRQRNTRSEHSTQSDAESNQSNASRITIGMRDDVSSSSNANRRRRRRNIRYNPRRHHRRLRYLRSRYSNELQTDAETRDEVASSNIVHSYRRRQNNRYNRRLYNHRWRRRQNEQDHLSNVDLNRSNEQLTATQSQFEVASSISSNSCISRQTDRYDHRRCNRNRWRGEQTVQADRNNFESHDSNAILAISQSEDEVASSTNFIRRRRRRCGRRDRRYNHYGHRRVNRDERTDHSISNRFISSQSLIATESNDVLSPHLFRTSLARRRMLVCNCRDSRGNYQQLRSDQNEHSARNNDEEVFVSQSQNEIASSSYPNRRRRRRNWFNNSRHNRHAYWRSLNILNERSTETSLNSNYSDEVLNVTQSYDIIPSSSDVTTDRRRRYNSRFDYRRYHRDQSELVSQGDSESNVSNQLHVVPRSSDEVLFPNLYFRRRHRNDHFHFEYYYPTTRRDESTFTAHDSLSSQSIDEIISTSNIGRHRRSIQFSWSARNENGDENTSALSMPIGEELLPDIVVRLDADDGDDGPLIWQQQSRHSQSGLLNVTDSDESLNSELVPVTNEMLEQIYPQILHHMIEHVSAQPFDFNQVIKFYIRNLNISETDVLYSLVTKVAANPGVSPNTVLNGMLGVNPSTDHIEADFSAAGDYNYPMLDEDLGIENPENNEDFERDVIIEIQFPIDEENDPE